MEIGSLADWTTALLTGGGLGAAVFQLRAGRIDNRKAEQQRQIDESKHQVAMARAVGIKAQWEGPNSEKQATVEFTLLNSSPYPISSVRVDIATDHEDVPRQVVIGTVLPGETVTERQTVTRTEIVFGEHLSGVTALFTDVFDNHWARTPHGLDQMELPPSIC